MNKTRPAINALRREIYDWKMWLGRALVLVFAAIAGLAIVAFSKLGDQALALFHGLRQSVWWMPLIWTPASTATVVWLTRRYAPGAAGSGIPQVIAALEPRALGNKGSLYVSLKLSVAKFVLTVWGLLAGLSLGREGPSVQVAAGIMHNLRKWIPRRARVSEHGLLVAGGAAGIAAAFNTPLAGVMFAIEELSRNLERRSHGLVLAAIVIAGLVSVSISGDVSYFGVIRVDGLSMALMFPGLLVAVASGLLGGLFARLLIFSATATSNDWLTNWRKRSPIAFAAGCGLVVAMLGIASSGAAFGSGYAHTHALLQNQSEDFFLYVPFKILATWLTTWSGVPGGIFAPSLAIGGALGGDIAQFTSYINPPTLIALGMAGFLAAVTQAPLTAFIIVMEMVDGHALVFSLMTCSLVASGVSRTISVPLYVRLAELQLLRLPHPEQKKEPEVGS